MTQPNFDDLNRLRSAALAHGAGSRQWIEFAQAMLDGYPSIYETAKAMNAQMSTLIADEDKRLALLKEAANELSHMHRSSIKSSASSPGGSSEGSPRIIRLLQKIDRVTGETNDPYPEP